MTQSVKETRLEAMAMAMAGADVNEINTNELASGAHRIVKYPLMCAPTVPVDI